MDRRLATSVDEVGFRIDATRCDGQGVCVLIAPELFALDRYGDAYVIPGSREAVAGDPDVRARGLEADAMCPRNAIGVAAAPGPPRALRTAEPAVVNAARRLTVDAPESVEAWRDRGGWRPTAAEDVLGLVERAGLLGHGGAAFPSAAKWQRLARTGEPVLVVNGAEREPGTLKDRYLLRNRPGLVLDGIRLAIRAIGASQGHIAIDDDSQAEHDALVSALADARSADLLDGIELTIHRVPTRYVVGEETALISFLGGGKAVPRQRPPYPSEIGLAGRPTLVHNVETLAQVALVVALGPEEFRSVGTPDAPGTGLFSVGPFGGPFTVLERPYGYSLQQLITDADLATGLRAVLVGGYAGGLLPPDALDVALTPDTMTAAGVSLGTKSVQVIRGSGCPVEAATRIVEYFAAETAEQCPPCSRGLPDMAKALRELESGGSAATSIDEVTEYMRTLFGRGVCRLPDGAARVTLSLLERFADDVAAHLVGGCPNS
jgi:NADH:ubiquinone oxidoreductase subunit F (NADH-binding)/ferredoxin